MAKAENNRLLYLEQSSITHIPKANGFDAVVGLVSSIFDMPVALICLVDAEQVWFNANHGLDIDCAISRHSFCDHVVTQLKPLVVLDAAKDHLALSNGIRSEPLGILFFAGVPLIENGICLGSLCVMDTQVRNFDEKDLQNLKGFVPVVLGILREHRQASLLRDQQREIQIRQARFEQTERSAKVGGFEMDLRTWKFSWSDQIYRTMGLPIGKPLTRKAVFSCYAPEEREHVERRIQAAVTGKKGDTDRDYRILTPQGEERWVHIVSDVEVVDGTPRRIFGILQDVTERYQHERGLEKAANSDSLTGLSNRACFKAALDRQIDQNIAEFGLLLIDVDHLKVTNDTLGHAAGDALLKEVAKRLVLRMGKKGTVFRLGGDEFAAVIEKPVNDRSMTTIASGLIRAISEPMIYNGVTINPRMTLGGAICDRCNDSEVLIQNADIALYHAKQTARGTYVHFQVGLRTKISRRLATTSEVELALSENRLFPYYQPIVQIRTGKIVAVEALVRLRQTDGSIKAAGEFHDALKDVSISHRVTSLMLEQVALDLRRWYDSGIKPLRIGINVSSSDFSRGDLESRIATTFARHALSLDNLRLEVTESVFMAGSEEAVAATLQRLRKKGASVALDDFGTGYASLTHLQRLPVDVIKIDKSFIDTMLTDAASSAIVELVLQLSRRMDLQVTAEGVETIEQAMRLDELGCASGQGYLYARPMDANSICTLLRAAASQENYSGPVLKVSSC